MAAGGLAPDGLSLSNGPIFAAPNHSTKDVDTSIDLSADNDHQRLPALLANSTTPSSASEALAADATQPAAHVDGQLLEEAAREATQLVDDELLDVIVSAG